MKIIGIIPARYGSTRFPGKPLADICGKPMIWWVYNQAKKAKKIAEIFVATDDDRIAEACNNYCIPYIMTSADHSTVTSRIHEVATRISADLYLVINGDEPLISEKIIEAVMPQGKITEQYYVGNLMSKIKSAPEVVDFTNIKVVTDAFSNAIYMSRSPIPYPKASIEYDYYKHLGVIIYNKPALDFYASHRRGRIEGIEDVDYLRFIENGVKVKMTEVKTNTLSVDNYKDLEHVRNVIRGKISQGKITIQFAQVKEKANK